MSPRTHRLPVGLFACDIQLGRTARRLLILALLAAGYAGAVGFVLMVSDGMTALRNHMSGVDVASL